MTPELLELLQSDIYTDAVEYAERVAKVKELVSHIELAKDGDAIIEEARELVKAHVMCANCERRPAVFHRFRQKGHAPVRGKRRDHDLCRQCWEALRDSNEALVAQSVDSVADQDAVEKVGTLR